MTAKLVGFGYPLLDIIIDDSGELLNSYGLTPNGQVHATGDLNQIFNYVLMTYGDSIQYVPGGSAINAIKVAQWCLGEDACTAVIGCLNGEDNFGQILLRELMQSRVKCYFQKTSRASTGTCLVICTDQNRSLVTCGGAAKLFSTNYFEELEIQSVLKHAQILYCTEADAFIRQCGYKINSIQEIALFLCKWEKCNGNSRTVVITRGPSTSILAEDGEFSEFPVVDISTNQIIDTNGAGDAFVGGFLASLIKGETSKNAMKAGHKAAHVILKQRGCSLPNN